MNKKLDVISRLISAADAMYEQIMHIRYQTWPSGTSEALGIYADDMDELLNESETAIRIAKKYIKLETSITETIKRLALEKLTAEERKALGH